MNARRRKHHGLRLRSLFLWHRYMGLAAALFVVLLASTGLLLNHTERLGLAQRYISAGPLLDWYGIEAATGSAAWGRPSIWTTRCC